MINVNHQQIGDRYFVSISGHANYVLEGEDLVCCAVSTLTQAFQFYIENLEDENKCSIQTLESTDGHFLIIVDGNRYMIQPAYDMLMAGLLSLIETYPKNISLMG